MSISRITSAKILEGAFTTASHAVLRQEGEGDIYKVK